MRNLSFIIVLFFSSTILASSLQIEIASSNSVFNSFQLPNQNINRVNLPDVTGLSYRLTGLIDTNQDQALYFLYAPLTLDYTARPDGNFEFNGTDFSGGTETNVSYKFNSYRIGYLWYFGSSGFRYWLGPIAKIRDADIKVNQSGLAQSFSNVGFVPLLGLGFSTQISNMLSLYFHIDGSAAPQGSAYDGVLEFRARVFEKLAVGLGFRVLGGGADNDRLKNFAHFESYTFALTYFW